MLLSIQNSRSLEWKIAQKDLFLDQGRELDFFKSTISVETTSIVICLEICFIFLWVILGLALIEWNFTISIYFLHHLVAQNEWCR